MPGRGESDMLCATRSGCQPAAETAAVSRSCEGVNPKLDLVYDLRIGGDSDNFFSDVARFSDDILARIERCAGALLDGYSRHVQLVLFEAPRSRGEYAIELLTLGMALRRYLAAAEETPPWAVKMAQRLLGVRRRFRCLKLLADAERAALTRYFFMPVIRGNGSTPEASVERLARLIEWMQATGEFKEEALRLNNWLGYIASMPGREGVRWMGVATELFDGFEREAAGRLGKYTRGVEGFLSGEYASRGIREDQLFCGRGPAEYYLNMVATEVMNRGLRARFERTSRRVVLVPACMRGAKAGSCRAHVKGVDMTCTTCDPECTVNRITRRMRELGAKVYLVPHSNGFSRWLDRWEREPNVGVTAVACLLNILPGGYEMRARDIPSQCVPLDYPGCKKHWDRRGISTGVNEERLVRIATANGARPTISGTGTGRSTPCRSDA
jgi:hypothetical protein